MISKNGRIVLTVKLTLICHVQKHDVLFIKIDLTTKRGFRSTDCPIDLVLIGLTSMYG